MKKQNLTLTIFISISLLAAVTLLITGGLWINTVQKRFHQESAQIRQLYVNNMKAEIKNSVDSLVQFIEYRKNLTEKILKEKLKERVENAQRFIARVYQENKNKRSEAEIKSQIVSSLRDIRFDNGQGYYFIDSLDGDVILYPIIPENEGKNLINLQDDRGNYALQQEIHLVNSQGKGYIEGYWKKPGIANLNFKKITYVEAVSPYNWYLGTGEYVDNMTRQIQDEITAYVNQLTYGHLHKQYIFIHNMQGVELANGLFPELIGKSSLDLEDINGVKVVEKQIEIGKSAAKSGFLTHYWPAPSGTKQVEKLTYVTAVPEWDWIVGSGIDMVFLEQLIAEKESELRTTVHEQVLEIIMLLIIIFILSLVIARIAVASINKNITFFINNMEKSSHNLSLINSEKVEYNDFKELALVSNKMTNRINMLLHNDELTGLYNRRYINKVLASLVKKSKMTGNNISIIMLDIDLFKQVNDIYGHQIGDRTLIEVACIIQDAVREHDYVGRYGGEEIIVVLPNTRNDRALEVAERIRIQIEKNRFTGIDKPITISGGVFTSEQASMDEMIKQADNNLYQAKHNGRNQIMG